MPVEIIPLSDTIGAEVRGVDLSKPIAPAVQRAISEAWDDKLILYFKGQSLSDDELKRSNGWLGPLGERTMPPELRAKLDADPIIMKLSNVRDDDGKFTGSFGDGEMWFHHDNSFVAKPHKATALYCIECKVEGGHTLFSNCYAAYESLPSHLKRAIDGRRVLQVYSYTVRERINLDSLGDAKRYWQPAVIVNPQTGRKALYIDRLMTIAVDGLPPDESSQLLDELFPYVERNDYEHVWQPGDYVLWDNRFSAHARTDFGGNAPRILKRITFVGDELVPAWPVATSAYA